MKGNEDHFVLYLDKVLFFPTRKEIRDFLKMDYGMLAKAGTAEQLIEFLPEMEEQAYRELFAKAKDEYYRELANPTIVNFRV